jgi:hypothetical protein
LNQVRSFVDENTGVINFGTLNDLLALLRQAYDDPDRAVTAQKEVKALKQRYLQFSAYLAEFRRLMGDLDWDDQAQRYHLEEGLCEEMKDALEWRPKATTLNELINLCVEFDRSVLVFDRGPRRGVDRFCDEIGPLFFSSRYSLDAEARRHHTFCLRYGYL